MSLSSARPLFVTPRLGCPAPVELGRGNRGGEQRLRQLIPSYLSARLVIVDKATDKLVGTGTLLIERKFIRSRSKPSPFLSTSRSADSLLGP